MPNLVFSPFRIGQRRSSAPFRRAPAKLKLGMLRRAPERTELIDEIAAGHGTGVQNMTDRVGALGGHVQIESAAGRGTRIAGVIPVTHAVHGATVTVPTGAP